MQLFSLVCLELTRGTLHDNPLPTGYSRPPYVLPGCAHSNYHLCSLVDLASLITPVVTTTCTHSCWLTQRSHNDKVGRTEAQSSLEFQHLRTAINNINGLIDEMSGDILEVCHARFDTRE